MAGLAECTAQVTYKRGETALNVTALVMCSELTASSYDGTLRHIDAKDFIFKTSDLSGIDRPERGDAIIFNNVNFEIVEPLYRELIPMGGLIRVFSQKGEANV